MLETTDKPFVRKVEHATVVVERTVAAPAAKVFDAWADAAKRATWDVPGDGWIVHELIQDFRVGGREASTFGPEGGDRYNAEGVYLDIEKNRRIVSAGTISGGGLRSSATLCTIELLDAPGGTHVIVTDQSAYLEGRDKPEWREAGWAKILEHLDAFFAGPDR